ncbi:MAG: phage tail assembly chaperone [Gammaproteobacteria bacterium]|nr:phage tail assembly chaperone [Gammaproteobacteria bacterium]
MAKLIIGKAPKTFDMPVEIPTPHGNDDVTLTAKHLTATAWAEKREAHTEAVNNAVNALFEQARAAAEKAYVAPVKKGAKAKKGEADKTPEEIEAEKEAAIVALIKPVKESVIKRTTAKMAAEMILQIAEGWDLPEPFEQASLEEMCNLYQGAASAIFAKYNELLEGRRLGN